MAVKIQIITCPMWGAKKAKSAPILCAESSRIIFHHTAGHHANIQNPRAESREEAIRYAQDIQNYHMHGNGWNDSGHNFLVCRNGLILQGRWYTVTAIKKSDMVVSAHCPGQNTQIGIEHEHISGEKPTTHQLEASARLMAWIADKYGRNTPLPVQPHSKYYATACPDNLKANIPGVVARAREILQQSLEV